MKSRIVQQIQRELENCADSATKTSAQRFFKEPVKFRGVTSPVINQIARKYWQKIKTLPKDEIFSLCEELLKDGYTSDAFIVYHWSERLAKQFSHSDFPRLERWVKTVVSNWAECDTLCNHTVASMVERFPEYLEVLKKNWTVSSNRWVRRAAAVTLIIPARNGKFLPEIFAIADALLLDQDDLVQKGYGWMLKAASQAHPQEVFAYVMKKKAVMPRTALRYAIEKLPDEMRKKAMEK